MSSYSTNSSYTYLKDTLFNFSKYYEHVGANGILNINDYKSIDWNTLKLYNENIDSSWFSEITILPNTNIEKVSLDVYEDENYWDVILLVNDMSPLIDTPFDFDVISDTVQDKLDNYENNVLKRTIPDDLRQQLYQQYEDEMIQENNSMLTLKYIKKERLYDYIVGLYDIGLFTSSFEKNEVYNVTDEE